ncbi:MAG: AMP-binding protein [Deltaproteobacteria bacterium]|nr:AMP-binding protein [Deltaproteobacteria bacterium]MBW2658863.1 AMP-binding protein [Deltaproteobacteria bacterium]
MNPPEIAVGQTTLSDIIELLADQFGDNSALEYHSLGIKNNFRQFRDICDTAARGLMALGVKKGEHVAIWANNIPEWVHIQYGSARMGAVLVTVNTSYRSFELEYLMKQSDSTTLLLTGGIREADEYLKVINEVCPELKECSPGELECKKLPKLKNVIYFGKEKIPGMYNWSDVIKLGEKITEGELEARKASLHPDDVINMQYTSGTTGFPKGVMLTHTNLIGNAKSMAECMTLTPEDAMCIPVPFFHCFGCVIGTLCCLVSGTTMAPVQSFTAKAVLETVESSRCSAVLGVPTMFIAELEEMENREYNTSRLRTGVMAGSPCPIEVMKAVVDKMGADEMTIVYGQTEASPGITQTRAGDSLELRVTTVGSALPNVEVKIIHPETGKECDRGIQGELCSKGYHVMKGYYKMDEATAKTIDRGKWLHTGDLAVMDENGYCKITGRITDMIIRGGENIYPREIEEFLYTHPSIKDVQVVGVPSAKYGEEVVAYVQLKPGAKSTHSSLKEFCKNKIAFHKIPTFFLFIDDYPTTASGKIQKYKLRSQATEELQRENDSRIATA